MAEEVSEVAVVETPEKRTIPGEMGFWNNKDGGWLAQTVQKGVMILEKIRNQVPLTEDDESIIENLYHRAWFFGWYIIPIEIELQPKKEKVAQGGLFDMPKSQENVAGTDIDLSEAKPISKKK